MSIQMKHLILSCIILCFLSCGNHEKKEFKEGLLCRCIVFPTGTDYETYQINVYKNGIIHTYCGLRNWNFDRHIESEIINADSIYQNIEEQKNGKLEADTLQQLKKYLSEIDGTHCYHLDTRYYKDYWCILIETASSISLHGYSEFDNKVIERIYWLLYYNSPMPIDTHGWA